MKKLKGVLTAEDFVVELEAWRRLWRRKAGGNNAAMRHAKDVARKHIRIFKRKHKITDLPRMLAAQSLRDVWNEASSEEVKLVFPYRIAAARDLALSVANGAPPFARAEMGDAFPDPVFRPPNSLDDIGGWQVATVHMRRRLKRMLHESIERNSDRRIDLINAGGAAAKSLPSLADAQFGQARSVRGLYLESVGAAILPHLSQADVAALEAGGATVLDNEIIAVVDPLQWEGMGGTDDQLWHLDRIDINAARRKGLNGKGVLVGILDTGIDPDHPEFAGKSIHYCAFDTKGAPVKHPAKDYDRHGTHVAAICAGKSVGVAPEANLAVAAVLTHRNASGRMCGFLYQIIAGINWLAVNAGPDGRGVDVINASLGGPVSDAPYYYQTIFGHHAAGKLMIAAIGNDGKSGIGAHGAPGRFQCVLAVGAHDADDHVAKFSSWGRAYEGDQPVQAFKPDLVAPGVNIYSALPGAIYGERSGTSMACPVVSGAAALLIEQDAALGVDANELTKKLLTLTSGLPPQLHNTDKRCYGQGRLHLAGI